MAMSATFNMGVMCLACAVMENIQAASSGGQLQAMFIATLASGLRKAVDSGVRRNRP